MSPEPTTPPRGELAPKGPKRFCFVVMPFRGEFSFLYLYLRDHLIRKHDLQVERGDHRKRTIPILEKIKKAITGADVVIGDMTGRNPNVFGELGLADVPTDVRHFEFVEYDLGHPEQLIASLDHAIHHVFFSDYQVHHDLALHLLSLFNQYVSGSYQAASAELFQSRVIREEAVRLIPKPIDSADAAEFLLPKIVEDQSSSDFRVQLTAWLKSKYGD